MENKRDEYRREVMCIGIAADHGGFELKVQLMTALNFAGYMVKDFGAYELATGDDFADFAVPMARAVAKSEVARGLAICGNGEGACVAVNQLQGVRAALITDSFSVHQGVEDDHMNVMCLGTQVGGYALAWDLVQLFLTARLKKDEMFIRILEDLRRLEISENIGRLALALANTQVNVLEKGIKN